ncbi:MAG: YbaB/EbfC family nucleoid-associated protein [Fimbriimonadaceae bacterium]|nr:YbaB/EbfC family nucleoid-associated protein [Fimbriimonadaceae bacterium]
MKLPKKFGMPGGGIQDLMANAQQAMARAQSLDQELAAEPIYVDRGPVKLVFNGLGELQTLKLDKSVVDPEDIEALEDLIVGAVRDGFAQATTLREAKVKEIMPNVPGLDKMGF